MNLLLGWPIFSYRECSQSNNLRDLFSQEVQADQTFPMDHSKDQPRLVWSPGDGPRMSEKPFLPQWFGSVENYPMLKVTYLGSCIHFPLNHDYGRKRVSKIEENLQHTASTEAVVSDDLLLPGS